MASVLATNKKARYEYDILESLESGIELVGCEVKSIRAGKVSLTGGFVRIDGAQAWLYGVNIAAYEQARDLPDPLRTRRLLLHKKQIMRLAGKASQKGFTIIPIKMYLVRGNVKLEIGLAKGKRQYDKRESIKKRELDRRLKRQYGSLK